MLGCERALAGKVMAGASLELGRVCVSCNCPGQRLPVSQGKD